MAPLGRLIVAVSMAVIVALPVRAAPQAGLDELLDALRVEDTVAIMREEGLRYGEGLTTEMLPDVNPDSWARVISRIYDTGKMTAVVEAEFAEAIAGTDLDPLVAFFTSDLGREIIALELSAREAFLDADTEAANDTVANAGWRQVPRRAQAQGLSPRRVRGTSPARLFRLPALRLEETANPCPPPGAP
jgi:hypothetical protein